MFGTPMHPVIVHFPIVFAVLLPVVALVALWAIRRGMNARLAWAVPVAFAAAMAASALVATETGEEEEDRVEKVVGDRPVDEHKEAGERFFVLSGVLLVIVAAGLLPRRGGRVARLVGTLAAFVFVLAAVQAGHTGGKLVYQYDAGRAYLDTTLVRPVTGASRASH